MVSIKYICDVCGQYENTIREKTEVHEKIPINEGGVDGWLFKCTTSYNIFKRTSQVNRDHLRLYREDWIHIDPENGKVKNWKINPERMNHELMNEKQCISKLTYEGSGPFYEISESEFNEVVENVMKHNPQLYAGTKFKRLPGKDFGETIPELVLK